MKTAKQISSWLLTHISGMYDYLMPTSKEVTLGTLGTVQDGMQELHDNFGRHGEFCYEG